MKRASVESIFMWTEELLKLGACIFLFMTEHHFNVLNFYLVKFVEEIVRLEHASFPNKPIYLVGDSFEECLALAVAARNPTINLVVILANSGHSCYLCSLSWRLCPMNFTSQCLTFLALLWVYALLL
ncbi:Acyltransferase-like protein [Camellia lanceoleosa]|uniref:Acyltransferase-like protein n=1 Tax=Camellia lanceoleosa TaxID=1840588 RepID=A0ACC0IZP6_9ERIC|nr:Acyltransferase-like protein [Camellia lanceoleosa]